MLPNHVFLVTVVAIITSGVTVGMIAQAWAEARKRAGTGASASRLDAIEARLVRMEQMIEAVSVEMERVAEGQRFTARLLSERSGSAAQPLASRAASPTEGRVVTPH